VACVALLLCGVAGAAPAAVDTPAQHIGGMSAPSGPDLPSPLRVVGGIVLTLALAVGGIVVLKRVQAKGGTPWNTQGIKVLARTTVGPSLRAHVLEIASSRVLVVEGRNGIGVTLLPREAHEAKEGAE
jgi:flagellar biogenesis protein FliO